MCSSTDSVAKPLILLDDTSALWKGNRLQLTYTPIAQPGVPVKVSVSQRGAKPWTLSSITSSSPQARVVLLPAAVSSVAKRFCIEVGSPPLRRSACARVRSGKN